jgi:Family of unknown function (DUF6527)
MRMLPLNLANWIFSMPVLRRPSFLATIASESPLDHELPPGLVVVEVRDDYLKWAHMVCPKCGDHIQLPLAGKRRWRISIDVLRRPTLSPSIWERRSCGAHFYIRKGKISWCK